MITNDPAAAPIPRQNQLSNNALFEIVQKKTLKAKKENPIRFKLDHYNDNNNDLMMTYLDQSVISSAQQASQALSQTFQKPMKFIEREIANRTGKKGDTKKEKKLKAQRDGSKTLLAINNIDLSKIDLKRAKVNKILQEKLAAEIQANE